MKGKTTENAVEREKCVLVGVASPKTPAALAALHLDELGRLAEAAGAEEVGRVSQRVKAFSSSTLVGEGKVGEIKALVEETGARTVLFDDDLTGSQVRNLEKRLPEVKVLDRTGLILDIFAKRAVTAESRLMVEVAQLQYMMPRLTGAWTHLCRQHNGGIGTKGPGETQLETDRRAIRKRVQELRKKLDKIESARESAAERRSDVFCVGVVGYTNAGKSSLTNLLTGASVLAEDRLFATLDSTTRRLRIGDETALLTDTVGFVRKLPHDLVETFRSTLGAAAGADCVLEVVDASAPDWREHLQTTRDTLAGIVDEATPRILLFNKIDRCDEERLAELREARPDAILASVRENAGLDRLRAALVRQLEAWRERRAAAAREELEATEAPWPEEGEVPQ